MAANPDKVKYEVAPGKLLRADAAASYLRMRKAGLPAGGVAVFSRSMAKQAELRRRYESGRGPIAARPSPTAPHINGRAMDLQTSSGGRYAPSAAHRWLSAGGKGSSRPQRGEVLRAHKYGWRRSVPSERWHYEYDPKRDKFAAADLKQKLAALGYPGALKRFQKDHKLVADGIAGAATWKALLEATDRKNRT